MGLRGQRHKSTTSVIKPALTHRSHKSTAVKRACARVVLGWVTSWEVLLLHPSFWVLWVPFRLATSRRNGFDPSHRYRGWAIFILNTRSQDMGRRNRSSEIFPRFLPHGRSYRLMTIDRNHNLFGRLRRKLLVGTLGGDRSNRDEGDGSRRGSLTRCFMRR